ncbi:hypothetical protein [Brachybacterium timonense]|uniref:hypothetical protein n=1 Tax=Brachybacterium timonense TaxID=2050896 RepID=UPI001FEA3E62|nr:hypothetical protein [Brachybacterium timonense]
MAARRHRPARSRHPHRPLEGELIAPAPAVRMPRRRGRWLTRDVPFFFGWSSALSTFLVFGMGSLVGGSGLLVPAAGALGVGAFVTGGLAFLLRNRRPAAPPYRALVDGMPESTRSVLESAAGSVLQQRRRIAAAQHSTPHPAVRPVLDHADVLLARVDALVRSPAVQSRRPYEPDVLLLEGMAERYLPELLGALEENQRYLASTFTPQSQQQALANLGVIEQQLAQLDAGVNRIESDLVQGSTRSLDVQTDFLQQRLHGDSVH